MTENHSPLVGVFDDRTKANRTIEQLRSVGIPDRQMQVVGKTWDTDSVHDVAGRKGLPEEKKPDFTRMGLAAEEARSYEDEYEAGYTLVFVHPGNQREQVMHILQSNGAYNYPPQPETVHRQESIQPEETGAMTPGMRPDDSSQTDIATTAGGVQALNVDPAVLEAELRHAQSILDEKEKAREERASESGTIEPGQLGKPAD
jgi:hypothetical protein